MSLDRFWQTLEELIGCADSRHGWSEALAGEFDQVSFLLRGTGTWASTIKCPSGGGEFCPRQVCPDGDGAFVAVCGNRPAQCHELKLSLDDVRVYALDVARLASDLANALCLRTDIPPAASARQTWRVGNCEFAAGATFPVYLTIQESEEDYVAALAKLQVLHEGPFAMLVPTRRVLANDLTVMVATRPIDLVVLGDVVNLASAPASLSCAARPETVFAKAWAATIPAEGRGENDRAWVLPPDARWEEMRFEFEATEMLRVTFRKQTRRFEPVDLKMRDERKKRPNLQWTSLQGLARKRGVLDWIDPSETATGKKQKQAMSDQLRAAFGIADDPIVWDATQRAYCARFIICGDVLSPRR